MGWGDGLTQGGASLDALFCAARRLPPLTADNCFFFPPQKNWIPSLKLKQARKGMSKEQQNELRAVRLLVQRAPTGQSRCRCCGGVIQKGELRVGYPTADPRGAFGLLTCWLHATNSCAHTLLKMLLPSELHPAEVEHLRQLLQKEQQQQKTKTQQQEESQVGETQEEKKAQQAQCETDERKKQQLQQEGEKEKQEEEKRDKKRSSKRVKNEIVCAEDARETQTPTPCVSHCEAEKQPKRDEDSQTCCDEPGDVSTVTSEGSPISSMCQAVLADEGSTPAREENATAAGETAGEAYGGAAGKAAETEMCTSEGRGRVDISWEGRNLHVKHVLQEAPGEKKDKSSLSFPSSSTGEEKKEEALTCGSGGGIAAASSRAAVEYATDSTTAAVEKEEKYYASPMHEVMGEALQLDLLCYPLHGLTVSEEKRLRGLLSEAAYWAADPQQAEAFQRQQQRAGVSCGEGAWSDEIGALGEESGDVHGLMKRLVERKIEGRIPSPPDLLLPLLPFQEEGLWWMCRQERSEVRGGILADEMGMGKTIQVIALLLTHPLPKLPRHLSLSSPAGSAAFSAVAPARMPRLGQTLIITPLASLLQWKGELERFVQPGRLSVLVYHGAFRSGLLRGEETLEKYDVILTTYQTVEQDFRKETNKHKRLCKYCGRLFLPEKLAVHQRYFCGPTAERTAKQRLTARKRGTQRAMETLNIKPSIAVQQQQSDTKGGRAALSAAKTADEQTVFAATAAEDEARQEELSKKGKKGNMSKRKDSVVQKTVNENRKEKLAKEIATSTQASGGPSPTSFVPTPSNVMRELMQEAHRDIRECGASWVYPKPLRFLRRRLPSSRSGSSSSSSSSASSTTNSSGAALPGAKKEADENEEEKCFLDARHPQTADKMKHSSSSSNNSNSNSNSSSNSNSNSYSNSSSSSSSSSSSNSRKKGNSKRKGQMKRKRKRSDEVESSSDEDNVIAVAAAAAHQMGFNGDDAFAAAVAADGCIEETIRILTEPTEESGFPVDGAASKMYAAAARGRKGRWERKRSSVEHTAAETRDMDICIIESEDGAAAEEEREAALRKKRKEDTESPFRISKATTEKQQEEEGGRKKDTLTPIQEAEDEEDEEEDEEEVERKRRALALRREIHLSKSDLFKQKIAVLQVLLRRCGLPTSGSKQQLSTRLSRLMFPSEDEETAREETEEEEIRNSSGRRGRRASGSGVHRPEQQEGDERLGRSSSNRNNNEEVGRITCGDHNGERRRSSNRSSGGISGVSREDFSAARQQTEKKEEGQGDKEAGRDTGRKLKKKESKKKNMRCSSSKNTEGGGVTADKVIRNGVRMSPRLVELQQQQQHLDQQRQQDKRLSFAGASRSATASSSSSAPSSVNEPKKTKMKKGKEENRGKAVKTGEAKKKKKISGCGAAVTHAKRLAQRQERSSRSKGTQNSSKRRGATNENGSVSSSDDESSSTPDASSEEEWTGRSEEDSSSQTTSLYSSSELEEPSSESSSEERESEGAAEDEEDEASTAAERRRRMRHVRRSSVEETRQQPPQQQQQQSEAATARGGGNEERAEEWDHEADPVEEEEEEEDTAGLGILMKRSVLHSIVWQRLVLDEAHRIKSRSSSTAQAVLALRTGRLVCSKDTRSSSDSKPRDSCNSSRSSSCSSSSRCNSSSNSSSSSSSSSSTMSETEVKSSSSDNGEEGRVKRSSSSSLVKAELEDDSARGKKDKEQKMKEDISVTEQKANLQQMEEKNESSSAAQCAGSTEGAPLAIAAAAATEEDAQVEKAVTYELKVGGGRWCLTGTPLQNRVGELFSLIKFLRVYPYAYYFCKKNGCQCRSLHFRFIEGRECVKCGHSRMSHFSLFNQKVINPIKRCGYQNEGIAALNNLKRDVLDVVLLRRTKVERAADVKLPPLVVRIRRDALSPEERDFYESLFKQTAIQFDAYVEAGTVLHNFAHIFDLLSRLRQAVDHPYLLVHGSLMPLDGVSLLPTASRNVSALGICALCQDDVEHADHLVEASCGHAFHRQCLAEYVASAPVNEDAAAAAKGHEGKPTEVLGCPACYSPLTVDLSILQRENEEEISAVSAATERGARVAAAAADREEEDIEGGARSKSRAKRKRSEGSLGGAADEEEEKEKKEEEQELEEVLLEEQRYQDAEVTEEKKGERGGSAVQKGQPQDSAGVAGVEHWLQQISASKAKGGSIMKKIKASEFRSSTKIEALVQELQAADRDDPMVKSLVFSQFCSMLDLIEWRLKKGGIRCAKFVGSMSVVSRSSVLYAFNNDASLKVLLISLKAGGEGLNLQAASRIFLMDPWWNPAAEMQAIQRAHRIGQRHKQVIATRFIAEKTIEERILQLQEKKQLVFDGTVGASQQAMAKLTQEDLRFLFQN